MTSRISYKQIQKGTKETQTSFTLGDTRPALGVGSTDPTVCLGPTFVWRHKGSVTSQLTAPVKWLI